MKLMEDSASGEGIGGGPCSNYAVIWPSGVGRAEWKVWMTMALHEAFKTPLGPLAGARLGVTPSESSKSSQPTSLAQYELPDSIGGKSSAMVLGH
jgi:hypothetical protein